MRALVPATGGGRRVYERNVLVYRHSWRIIFSGFLEPIFYLVAVGVGIGELVGGIEYGGRAIDYDQFVAPALLASSAMNGAVYESTMNIYFKLKEARTYEGMLATPMGVGDVALGELGWCLTRGALYAVGFQAVLLALGLVESWWAVLAVPGAILIGFAFAAAGMAATAYMRSWQDFDMVQMVTLPLFLFSATFYPLSTYPDGMQWIVRVTPLYQGVDLLRALTLGDVGIDALGHALYLALMGVACLAIVGRRFERLLLT